MAKKKIKIILLKDVPGLGHKFEITEVALGYFRNYLTPNNMAEIVTDKVLARLEEERKKAEEEKRKRIAENKKRAEELKNQTLTFPIKVGDKGQVYGSITEDDIVEKLIKEGYENISVNLSHPLKELGESQVCVDFSDGVKVLIKVVLEKEEGSKKKP